jgi:hypothetical protein
MKNWQKLANKKISLKYMLLSSKKLISYILYKKFNHRARKRIWEKSEIPFHFFQEDQEGIFLKGNKIKLL